jgi:hypothetical protein
MLDTVGPEGYFWSLASPQWPALFEDLPEAIKAHSARAGAAKPRGLGNFGIRIADFGISEGNG